jgi:hypothetical protein
MEACFLRWGWILTISCMVQERVLVVALSQQRQLRLLLRQQLGSRERKGEVPQQAACSCQLEPGA